MNGLTWCERAKREWVPHCCKPPVAPRQVSCAWVFCAPCPDNSPPAIWWPWTVGDWENMALAPAPTNQSINWWSVNPSPSSLPLSINPSLAFFPPSIPPSPHQFIHHSFPLSIHPHVHPHPFVPLYPHVPKATHPFIHPPCENRVPVSQPFRPLTQLNQTKREQKDQSQEESHSHTQKLSIQCSGQNCSPRQTGNLPLSLNHNFKTNNQKTTTATTTVTKNTWV